MIAITTSREVTSRLIILMLFSFMRINAKSASSSSTIGFLNPHSTRIQFLLAGATSSRNARPARPAPKPFRRLSVRRCASNTPASAERESRAEILHRHLRTLDVDPRALAEAAEKSSLSGHDPRYGKSALRAYKSYLNSASRKESTETCARRTARQIDFLVGVHGSRTAEWIRHTDDADKERTEYPLTVVLDNVRSAFNVGSIYRSADACGCTEVITTGITPHPLGNGWEKLAKSGLGAEGVVATRHFNNAREVVSAMRAEYGDGVMLVGMETTSISERHWDVSYKYEGGGTVLFLGNEVHGVTPELLQLMDVIVEIPMFGQKNSLNIAASAPVVMYEVLRQWESKLHNDS